MMKLLAFSCFTLIRHAPHIVLKAHNTSALPALRHFTAVVPAKSILAENCNYDLAIMSVNCEAHLNLDDSSLRMFYSVVIH